MATQGTQLALRHFDSLYSKVFGKLWPSSRLGLLSPKKHCLVSNSMLGEDERSNPIESNQELLNIRDFYRCRLERYEKELERRSSGKKTKVVAPEAPRVGEETGEKSEESDGSLSSAEDLLQMFSDRHVDDDEKYFINRASTQISMNDFVPATELIAKETMPVEFNYEGNQVNHLNLDIEHLEEPAFSLSEELDIYTFPRRSCKRFDGPDVDIKSNLMPYYLMDGASILPVLAMDLQIGEECADYCAAPGGKSLTMLMSLRPQHLLCNDVSPSRLGRMYEMFRQYLPNVSYIRDALRLSNRDAASLVLPNSFDKILVDVPCSNDRISLNESDNNLFRRSRMNERLDLPRKQTEILASALKSVRVNGSVVYSTCTMSPIENDGVVQSAIARLNIEEPSQRYGVVSLKEAFRPFRGLYKFYTKFNYGQQVIPNIESNFGPMYISKIKRLS